MTRSLEIYETSIIERQAQQPRPVVGPRAVEVNSGVPKERDKQTSEPGIPGSGAWNEAICCEARNSLQVVLSGAEILLEDHLGNLLAGQKELLAKMTDNAHYLSQLLSALLGPEEFKIAGSRERSTGGSLRVPAKV